MHSAVRARRAGEAQERTDSHLERIAAALGISDMEALRQAPARVREPQDVILHEREGTERVLARIADVLEGATPIAEPQPDLDLAVATGTLAMYFGVATREELTGKQASHADLAQLLTGCVERLRASIVEQSITTPDDPPPSDEDPLDVLLELAQGENMAPHDLMRLDLDSIPEDALAAHGWQLVDVIDGEGSDGDDEATDTSQDGEADDTSTADDAADPAEATPQAAPKATRKRKASTEE